MEALHNIIKAIETFIRINGDRFKLYYIKYDLKGELLPFRKITQIEQEYGSIKNYLHHFIDTYNPERIEVVTKKPNGSSHGIRPQYKTFEIKPQMNLANQNHTQLPSLPSHGLAGVEKIHALETTLLNRELQKETSRAERYENLYHELREKHFELEKDHKLLKDKTDLERERTATK